MSGEANFRPVLEVRAMSVEEARRRYGVFRLEDQEADYASARRTRIDVLLQVAIGVLTIVSLWLITSDGPYARWGHVLGLVSQPFWIAATWRARQWGMLFVALMLVGLWLRGIANHF